MEWITTNWEWILLGFYTLEKIVKLSPSKKDDIIFDSIINQYGRNFHLVVKNDTRKDS